MPADKGRANKLGPFVVAIKLSEPLLAEAATEKVIDSSSGGTMVTSSVVGLSGAAPMSPMVARSPYFAMRMLLEEVL